MTVSHPQRPSADLARRLALGVALATTLGAATIGSAHATDQEANQDAPPASVTGSAPDNEVEKSEQIRSGTNCRRQLATPAGRSTPPCPTSRSRSPVARTRGPSRRVLRPASGFPCRGEEMRLAQRTGAK